MKKNYVITLLVLFCFGISSSGQEMLLNGDFENWDDDNSPTSWTKVENTSKEATEKHGGSFSAKHVGGTKDLGQTISGIIAGDSYTITVWYKVAVEADGSDIRIWSYWKDSSNGSISDDATDDLIRGPNNSYFDNNGGAWTKYEVTVIAPTNAVGFYFELRTYSGATVYWDDLSFVKNTTASVDTRNNIIGFKSYPNPVTKNQLTISSNSTTKKEVVIYNLLGKKVLKTSFYGEKATIDVSSIHSGIYMLRVLEDGKQASKKLVVK
ncbi:T9SS type A sorting domain-containing protein [uncultured Polaribacter sp.]|uniref:T9SS type A sorting domain-containing protein n=1 Tax=uncultured Polaribacter sp. TaxID=174711 RepID=UPI002620CA2B|nr:T9SS type A sorting domain-containing protein [uncultured Polaribacter sp.]